MFKKLVYYSLLLLIITMVLPASLSAQSSTVVKKATLVNPQGDKVVVAVGSSAAQQYFSLGYVLLTANLSEKKLGGSGLGNVSINVIGTRTGSSTTAVGFSITSAGGQSATSTYETYIGRDLDIAIYDIYFKSASSTANARFSILASPDNFCAATSTTYYSGLNNYVKSDVFWFDAGDHFTNKVHSTSLAVGTSTIAIDNPVAGTGKQIVLENINSQCLALQVSASSTEIQARLSTKQK